MGQLPSVSHRWTTSDMEARQAAVPKQGAHQYGCSCPQEHNPLALHNSKLTATQSLWHGLWLDLPQFGKTRFKRIKFKYESAGSVKLHICTLFKSTKVMNLYELPGTELKWHSPSSITFIFLCYQSHYILHFYYSGFKEHQNSYAANFQTMFEKLLTWEWHPKSTNQMEKNWPRFACLLLCYGLREIGWILWILENSLVSF